MIIEEKDFQLEQSKNSECFWDLKFKEKETFKIFAYGIPIHLALNLIVYNRINIKYLEEINLKTFIKEEIIEFNKLKPLLNKYFIIKNKRYWLKNEFIN